MARALKLPCKPPIKKVRAAAGNVRAIIKLFRPITAKRRFFCAVKGLVGVEISPIDAYGGI
jgi:hypothetical protein